ncbi:MAG: hypothetical protein JRN72_04040 [Nitrososphaerota archaeon]|nr:hypothetical protein [Nitrososphaerota archaeon]
MSLCLVWFSGGLTYGVWLALPELSTLARGTISLLLWVGSFAAGSALLWRGSKWIAKK